MSVKEFKSECCIDREPLPSDFQYLVSYICKEFNRLFRRHRLAFVKNSRIMELAKPKSLGGIHRFVNRCPCFLKKDVEIVRLYQRANTRMEQLAYPRVRDLLLLKQQVRKYFTPDRIINLNRLIRSSLFSLYSRLGNVQPPMEMKRIRKWDKIQWERHTKLLKKLATPKAIRTPSNQHRKIMPLSKMKRYKYLAKPKEYHLMEKSDWIFTRGIRNHSASERTINLAKPLIRNITMLYSESQQKIPLAVLKHKASDRLIELSKPNIYKSKSAQSDLKKNPFAVSPQALKHKASKRTKELSKPKEYDNPHIRENPYAISKAALKAKAKPRTLELSKPTMG